MFSVNRKDINVLFFLEVKKRVVNWLECNYRIKRDD